jgi:hypothetical protein
VHFSITAMTPFCFRLFQSGAGLLWLRSMTGEGISERSIVTAPIFTASLRVLQATNVSERV